jgi:hypothetical protein
MKVYLCFMLIILTGCSGKHGSPTLSDKLKMSTAQAFLNGLKDSMIYQYNSVGSENEKQKVLDKYYDKLKTFLLHKPMDSIRVTIDEVTAKGFTVTTKTHFSSIEFGSKITFKDSMPPRLDSIYKYAKSLQPGSTVLLNLAFNGDFQIITPDSTTLLTFKIAAFPIPLQYTIK